MQAPPQWYKKFNSFRVNHSFHKTHLDHCVLVKNYLEGKLIILLYIDSMLIVGFNTKKIVNLKDALSKSTAMNNLGQENQILGMSISHDRKSKKALIIT